MTEIIAAADLAGLTAGVQTLVLGFVALTVITVAGAWVIKTMKGRK